MRVTMRSITVVFATFSLAACGGGGASSPPPAGLQSSYPANVAPVGFPPYVCLPPGGATQAVMQKLNAFWRSAVQACACDLISTPQCQSNGFVTPFGYGYIYYDPAFLNRVDAASGSPLPADFFMAHEFGHNIQLALSLNPPGKAKELQADCLGGYYVGYQIYSGQVRQSDVVSTFQFACSIGDPFVSNWWDPTHGVCSERVAALQRGIDGHTRGGTPGGSCTY
ncbi:MAG: hypothetical protein WAQ05_02085 [Rubrivivax sp.]